jgi:hypothetical protein
MAVGELTSWTVRLVSKSKPNRLVDIAGHKVSTITRSSRVEFKEGDTRYTIRRVLSPPDESIDLDSDQVRTALVATNQAAGTIDSRTGKPKPVADVPLGGHVRNVRRQDQVLLTIYLLDPPVKAGLSGEPPIVAFGASFPKSRNPKKTEYVVNSIYLQEDVEMLIDDEDDE